MTIGRWRWQGAVALAVGLAACVDGSPPIEGDGDGTSGGSSTTGPVVGDVTGPPMEGSTGGLTTDSPQPGTTTVVDDSSGPGSTGSTGEPGCEDCPEAQLDVVFVVDNSVSMGAPQHRLATAAEALMEQFALLEADRGIELDLHLMVTTTDFGNPLCTPFQPAGYSPSMGAPIDTPCVDRLDDFESLNGLLVTPEICTDVCGDSIAPSDPFVAVRGGEDNVPDGTALDALQCLLPQGLIGCGFESPLETMLQALNPGAGWNQPGNPFLRDDAALALVLLTDEMDCSAQDYSIFDNPELMNANPNTGSPQASSAICWNAGVSCDGPDGMGIYSDCMPTVGSGLHATARYRQYLIDELVGNQGKEVMMLALTGVPQVVEHSTEPPFEPVAGGIDDLVVRDWIDFPYPAGDIIPSEWALGIDAAEKTFQLGIGPACTTADSEGTFTQAVPAPRIQEVCQALDEQEGAAHCCIESVCDDDYSPAMNCLRGMLETSL
ncbi:MAG: hypothetical protein AAF799_37875 [Myxococcota bacterium]